MADGKVETPAEINVPLPPAEGKVLIGIPTRDRPEYLSGLLTTLFYQDYKNFDVLIVDTSEGELVENAPQVARFIGVLRAMGHGVRCIRGDKCGRSMVVPVNRILIEAENREYDWVYKIDDDHICPPNTLSSLIGSAMSISGVRSIVSGVTPWMWRIWENSAGPDDPCVSRKETQVPLTDIWIDTEENSNREFEHRMRHGHFHKYDFSALVRTKLGSAANFLMRPDTRILWSDSCGYSLYADAFWFLQLQRYLDYELYFHTGLWIWHVTAPSGGVRREDGNYDKDNAEEEKMLRLRLDRMLKIYGFSQKGGLDMTAGNLLCCDHDD